MILARDSFSPGSPAATRDCRNSNMTALLFSLQFTNHLTPHVWTERIQSVISVMETRQTFVSFESGVPSLRIPWKIRISNYYWKVLSLSLSLSLGVECGLYNCVNHKDNIMYSHHLTALHRAQTALESELKCEGFKRSHSLHLYIDC